MKYLLTIFTITLIFTSLTLKSQKIDYSQDWINDFNSDKNLTDDENFKNCIKTVDLSEELQYVEDSLMPWEFHGIFGSDNHKIDIVFINVKKDRRNPLKYYITGKSRLKGNICDFKGYLIITDIKKSNENYYSKAREDTIYYGRMIAKYELKEDSSQYGSGVFKGIFGSIVYSNITNTIFGIGGGIESDENQKYQGSFVGVWQNYKTEKIKRCIWIINSSIKFPYPDDFWIVATEKDIEEYNKIRTCQCPICDLKEKINPLYINNGWNDTWIEHDFWWQDKKE